MLKSRDFLYFYCFIIISSIVSASVGASVIISVGISCTNSVIGSVIISWFVSMFWALLKAVFSLFSCLLLYEIIIIDNIIKTILIGIVIKG